MAIKRVNRAEWARRVELWKASNKSSVAFATEQGWNPKTFAWWASIGLRRPGNEKALSFVEVTPTTSPARPSPVRDLLEVRLRNGRRIRLLGDVDVVRLRSLVAALES